jgi:hypothetical protein
MTIFGLNRWLYSHSYTFSSFITIALNFRDKLEDWIDLVFVERVWNNFQPFCLSVLSWNELSFWVKRNETNERSFQTMIIVRNWKHLEFSKSFSLLLTCCWMSETKWMGVNEGKQEREREQKAGEKWKQLKTIGWDVIEVAVAAAVARSSLNLRNFQMLENITMSKVFFLQELSFVKIFCLKYIFGIK